MSPSYSTHIRTSDFPDLSDSTYRKSARDVQHHVINALASKVLSGIDAIIQNMSEDSFQPSEFYAFIQPLPLGSEFEPPRTVSELSTANVIVPSLVFERSPLPAQSDNDSLPSSNMPPNTEKSMDSSISIPSALEAVKARYGDDIPASSWKSISRARTRVVRYLIKQPARNSLRYNTTTVKCRKDFNGKRLSNINAALLQVSGQCKRPNSRCSKCLDGKGPWDSCVVPPPGLDNAFAGACANCSYNNRAASCSFYRSRTIPERATTSEELPTEYSRYPAPDYTFKVRLEITRKFSSSQNQLVDIQMQDEYMYIILTADQLWSLAKTALHYISSELSSQTMKSILLEALVEQPPKF
ncbi:hypothetical protein F4804DRAFT_334725 [Jackrogersella minutella]|nr:hypothetical protein F4804DRAFT_334725 [Jackrogersella minutella]